MCFYVYRCIQLTLLPCLLTISPFSNYILFILFADRFSECLRFTEMKLVQIEIKFNIIIIHSEDFLSFCITCVYV